MSASTPLLALAHSGQHPPDPSEGGREVGRGKSVRLEEGMGRGMAEGMGGKSEYI